MVNRKNVQKTQEYNRKQRARGLTQVRVWVPVGREHDVRALGQMLRDEGASLPGSEDERKQ